MKTLQERPTAVKRIRSQTTDVHWPSEHQMKQRGCTPYVEPEIGDQKWRIHFQLPQNLSNERPSTIKVKSQGAHHELYLQNDQGCTAIEVVNKQVTSNKS